MERLNSGVIMTRSTTWHCSDHREEVFLNLEFQRAKQNFIENLNANVDT